MAAMIASKNRGVCKTRVGVRNSKGDNKKMGARARHTTNTCHKKHDTAARRSSSLTGKLLERSELNFTTKLHVLLSDNLFSDVMSWQAHGRCFMIHDEARLLREVLPEYGIPVKNIGTLHRQLKSHGFQRMMKAGKRPNVARMGFCRPRTAYPFDCSPCLFRLKVQTRVVSPTEQAKPCLIPFISSALFV